MQWSPDILDEIWTHVRSHTGMWHARMKKRLWAEVHKELGDDWGSWRSYGIFESYFKNYPLPYTIVTNSYSFEHFEDSEDFFSDLCSAQGAGQGGH